MATIIQMGIFVFFISTTFAQQSLKQFQPDHDCGSWTPFTKDFCYQIYPDAVTTFPLAQQLCQQTEGANTLKIINPNEQSHFQKILTDLPLYDNIWLGAVQIDVNNIIEYVWPDPDTEEGYTLMKFKNWAAGHPYPSNQTQSFCVQMVNSMDDEENGKWITVPCQRSAAIICQRGLEWINSRIRKEVMALNERLEEIEKNPVPLGFIYVQFPWQKQPNEIWPKVSWGQVTEKYAGVFFRALGGNSADFEQLQAENAPRIEKVTSHKVGGNSQTEIHAVDLPVGGRSGLLWTGDDGPGYQTLLTTAFHTGAGEVRPKNLGVKIWVRNL